MSKDQKQSIEDLIYKSFKLKLTKEERIESYKFIENFIESNVKSWDEAPDTDSIETEFTKEIKKLDNNTFAFLLVHSGYIPEFYEHDSSQETLYSKLIESLVCEWAIRIGFSESYLQKQKSNKEDITIKINNSIIVSDSKSFRLGRSQKAPNVKDTIKQKAYIDWLKQYPDNDIYAGLISFPSLMNWKSKSTAFEYFTDKELPILFLFYEHLSFFVLCEKINHETILGMISDYPTIFEKTSSSQEFYFSKLEEYLINGDIEEEYSNFKLATTSIINEKVSFSINEIVSEAKNVKSKIENEINDFTEEQIKKIAIDASFDNSFGQYLKQLHNIKKFRTE